MFLESVGSTLVVGLPHQINNQSLVACYYSNYSNAFAAFFKGFSKTIENVRRIKY
jgi:hypothetical protein